MSTHDHTPPLDEMLEMADTLSEALKQAKILDEKAATGTLNQRTALNILGYETITDTRETLSLSQTFRSFCARRPKLHFSFMGASYVLALSLPVILGNESLIQTLSIQALILAGYQVLTLEKSPYRKYMDSSISTLTKENKDLRDRHWAAFYDRKANKIELSSSKEAQKFRDKAQKIRDEEPYPVITYTTYEEGLIPIEGKDVDIFYEHKLGPVPKEEHLTFH